MEEDFEDIPLDEINIIPFAIVLANGDVVRTGNCDIEILDTQADTSLGETAIELGFVPDDNFDEEYYYDGEYFVELPAKPGDWAVFNYDTKTWVDTRPANRDDDFSELDYTFECEVYIDPATDRFHWNSGTATRNNGRYSEEKAIVAGFLQWTADVQYIVYDWDTNSVSFSQSYQEIILNPRAVFIGQYAGGDKFKNALTGVIIDGNNLLARSIGAEQLVADKAIIRGAQIEELSVDRLNLANGAVSDQGDYAVSAYPRAYTMYTRNTDYNTIQFLDDKVSYNVDANSPPARLILTPRIFNAGGSAIANFQTFPPLIDGVYSLQFTIGFRLTRYTADGFSNSVVSEKSATLATISWKDKIIQDITKASLQAGITEDMDLFLGTHYEAGDRLELKVWYNNYTSNENVVGSALETQSYGFTWKAFWK